MASKKRRNSLRPLLAGTWVGAIDQPNQVWCADVTYIPMRRGFPYLVAIMASKKRRNSLRPLLAGTWVGAKSRGATADGA